ncbi:MAG: hypothetical protein ACI3VB_01640 [Oscillospiraceae bacterium]
MQVNQYFSHEKIPDKGDKIYIVVEHYAAGRQKTIGVVTGVESVCVINAGMGMTGDLRKYVEDMLGTDKTIECVSLTGKPEDVGASAAFDVAYLEDRQRWVYQEHGCKVEERRALFAGLCRHNEETMAYGEALMLDNRDIAFKKAGDGIGVDRRSLPVGPHMFDSFGDGFMFHLGGTVVELAELPAQSEGQLIAISPTCCISFVGDAIEPVTDLSALDRAGLEKYAGCLARIIDYATADTPYSEGLGRTPHVFYYSASSIPMTVPMVENVLAACRQVLEGKTAGDMPAGTGDTCRIHFVENNGVIYDAARLD